MKCIINFFRNLFVPNYEKMFTKLVDVGFFPMSEYEIGMETLTAKEAKLISDYFAKKSIKFEKMSESLFSQEEKLRVENCKEGDATTTLDFIAINWLNTHNWTKDSKYKEIFIAQRPSTKTLLGSKTIFSTKELRKFYNIYFASWYYKKHWNRLVNKWLEEA